MPAPANNSTSHGTGSTHQRPPHYDQEQREKRKARPKGSPFSPLPPRGMSSLEQAYAVAALRNRRDED